MDESVEREFAVSLMGDDLQDKKNSSASFLKMAPPVSTQQTVEFSQVFRLPLSRSFRAIYAACYEATHPIETRAEVITQTAQYVQQNVKLIDLRPKRWYRELAVLAKRASILDKKRVSLSKDIDELEAKFLVTTLDNKMGDGKATYENLEKVYLQSIREHEAIIEAMAKNQQQRDGIIREISQNGYVHTVADGKDSINVSRVKDPNKIPILKKEDLADKEKMSDDTKWAGLAAQLEKGLLVEHNPLISPVKTVRFRAELKELALIGNNPTITGALEKYRKDIEALDSEMTELDAKMKGAVDQSKVDVANQIGICTQQQATFKAEIAKRESFLAPIERILRGDVNYEVRDIAAVLQQHPEMTREQIVDYLIYTRTGGDHFHERSLGRDYHTNWGEVLEAKRALSSFQSSLAVNIQELARLNAEDSNAKAAQKIVAEATDRIETCKSQRALLMSKLEEYKANALPQARAQFIAEWNNPQNYDSEITQDKVDETVDPLKAFYEHANKTFGYRNVHRFVSKGGDFYTESGLPLHEFMSQPGLGEKAALFPCVAENGEVSTELFWGVESPQKAGSKFGSQFPAVRFVETNELQVSWKGYALSSLAEAVNLFPGEKKQIIVEKQTKLTRTVNQSKKENQEEQRHLTSSFEENLRSELSTSANLSKSDQRTQKTQHDQSTNDKSGSKSSAHQENENDWSASAHGSFFGGSLTADAKASSNSKFNKDSSQSQSKEVAFKLSQYDEGQALNKSTRDVAAKNVQNTVNKVSSETSSNNKLEVSSSSSEQYEESKSNKESMQIENPNLGRTVNYNFYQLQNVYATRSHLKDVKIVLDTGIPLMEGVDITAKVVCELEEFNKLFKLLPKSDFATVLCAYIARRVLKNYAQIISDPANMGILRLKAGRWESEVELINKIQEIYRKLSLVLANCNFEKPKDDGSDKKKKGELDNTLKAKITELELALGALQKFTFVLNETQVLQECQHVVNAPAYHVDTQLGQLPATENYLERHREVELDRQKAKTVHVLAKAEHERKKGAWCDFHGDKLVEPVRVIDSPPVENKSSSTSVVPKKK
jgi:predicted DNA-binding antitoxin AbrB/MazE fold protein